MMRDNVELKSFIDMNAFEAHKGLAYVYGVWISQISPRPIVLMRALCIDRSNAEMYVRMLNENKKRSYEHFDKVWIDEIFIRHLYADGFDGKGFMPPLDIK